MIIVDLQQVMISNLHMQLKGHTNAQLDENMLLHMVLNSLRGYNARFRETYGEMVIACDDRKSWRRDIFPYYKVRRKLARNKSELDWTTIHSALDIIKADLKQFFPYRVIQVEGAEADDVIASVCHEFGRPIGGEPILIVSGDKDFKQLCRYNNVSIYDPIKKQMVKVADPVDFLLDLTIRGDAGDDIPNILSQDDSFAAGIRQKQLRETKIEELKSQAIFSWPEHIQRNFHRNDQLINLWNTPKAIQEQVIATYNEQSGKGRSHLFNYFIKNRLSNLLESINEF